MRILTLFLAMLLSASTVARAEAIQNWELAGRANFVDQMTAAIDQRRMLIIGESHGTNEAQQLVTLIVRKIAQERTVMLALEIPKVSQKAVDRYLASSGTRSDVEALLSDAFWTGFSDGRNSLAMLRLIEHSRTLNEGKANIRVVCMDPAEGKGASARDAGMATNIEAAAKDLGDPITVVLVGNYHSRPISDSELSEGALNLVSELKSPASVWNLGLARGAMWVCGREGCGPRIKKSRNDQGVDEAVLKPLASSGRHHFNELHLPQFTPSYPAKELYLTAPN